MGYKALIKPATIGAMKIHTAKQARKSAQGKLMG
jgi:hypothetical protein